MDITPAGPWIGWLVLATVLVLAGLAAALLRRRRAGGPPPGREPRDPGRGYADDDLPGFLETPPGSADRPAAPPAGGWAALAAAPAATSPAPPGATAARSRRRRAVVGGALALTALLVAVAVAVLASPGRHGGPGRERPGGPDDHGAAAPRTPPAAPTPGDPGAGELAAVTVRPGRDGGAARLEFGGLVLEQRAVGVTATYPSVEVSWHGGQAVAHLRLPTFNCLSAQAPADPVAAGCAASRTEYADLVPPELGLTDEDGTVRLTGRFPTYLRPNGSPPVWTGRVYEVHLRAAPVDGRPAEGWVRAEGEIRVGSGRAASLDDPDVTVLRGT